MKKSVLIVVMVLFAATNLSAMTIDTESKRDTVYSQRITVQESFGKLPSSGEYGIFLNIKCKTEEGEDEHESLFYRLNSEVVKDGKNLYTMIDGKKIMLAEKKWYGWVAVDGVKIQYSMERTPYPTFKVWVEVE
jgi:hypothetical protein